MIFGRKKNQDIDEVDEVDQELDVEDEGIEDEDIEDEEELDQWAAFDLSQDWREDGPFDISEVDLGDDEVARLDLGCMIITPEQGMSLKLIASAENQQVMHLVVENSSSSAVQVTVFAAPSDPGYCHDMREKLIEDTVNAQSIELVKGPFGTELRRIITMTDDRGRQGFAPVRDWFISGPRWILNARFMGDAALDMENTGVSAELKEFIHNIIVRRGDTAMMPGAVLPLTPGESQKN